MHVAYTAHVKHVLLIAFVRNKNCGSPHNADFISPIFYIFFFKSKYSSPYPAITTVYGSFLVCRSDSSLILRRYIKISFISIIIIQVPKM